jgi:chemotaxis protein histidine kinase CheA
VRFARIEAQAQALARRLGKAEPEVVVDDGDVRLPADRWAPLWANLAHVVRNAVDHGLETEAERRVAGKPARGRLTLRSSCESGQIVVEVADDGRGVAWEAVRARAEAAGLARDSREDLSRALLADGLSTRSEASEVSGRGVGMGAVAAACAALGGRVEVESEPGQGTCVRLLLPLADNVRPLRPTAPPPDAPGAGRARAAGVSGA